MTLLFVFLSLYIGISIRASIIVGIIELLILLIYSFFKLGKKKALLFSIFALVGVGFSFFRPSSTKEIYKSVVVEVKENYYIVSSSLEKLYVYEPNTYREVGDILYIEGDKKELDFVSLESEFDFKEYLNSKGIYYKLEVKNIEVKFSNPIKIHLLKKNFLEKFDDNSKGIVASILFGLGSKGELNEVNKALHLMRLVSSSGIYLYFFLNIFKKILMKVIKKDKVVDIVSLSLLLPYLIFTFPKFIVIKFMVMRIFYWINKYLLNNRFRRIEVISLTGILFLLIDYHYAYQDGFFLAYFIQIISLFFSNSFKFKKKWIQKISLTLVIYLSFIPFEAKFYNEISIFSIPLQMILIPFYILLYLMSTLSFIGLPLVSVISIEVNSLTKILNTLTKAMLKLYVPSFHDVSILIYEIAFILLLYFASIKLRPVKNLLSVVFIGLMSLYIIPVKYFIKSYVSFINVGQGDSTLIKYKNSTILVDTGGNKYKDIAKDVLIPYFKSQQIYRIDLLITTHDDFDHSGAVKSLVNNFTVKEYIKDYTKFPLIVGDLTLTNYNIYPELWSEENDRSLVIGFSVNNYSYLIMGDAPIKIENAIISDNKSIKCDILKIGHHGSKTSTSENFINYLRPKVAVISCGKDNMYGHPHSIVLAILRKYHVEIHRTDIESTITF